MTGVTIGLLHPGEMGAAIGSVLRERGHTVLWASSGRSAATTRRAESGGLIDVRKADASDRAVAAASRKGWRWVAEMEEIAATFAAADLPEGFHRAAADVFRRAKNDGPTTPR